MLLPCLQKSIKPNNYSPAKLKNFLKIVKFDDFSSPLGTSLGIFRARSASNYFSNRNKTLNRFQSKFYTPACLINDKKYYTTANTQNENVGNNGNNIGKIDTQLLAKQFLLTLNSNEKLILKEALIDDEISSKNSSQNSMTTLSWKQIGSICLARGLPFIGFGFVDNFIMIVAGDLIEYYIGFFLPISTMAAAGLGNAFSDVAGIGLAHHIENFCLKILNEPNVTADQLNKPFITWCLVLSKSLCIFVGCLIGMVPLLFSKHGEKEKEKTK